MQKLWRIARLLAPADDVGWLHEFVLDLKAIAVPSRRPPSIAAEALHKLGLALHKDGIGLLGVNDKEAAKLIRDGAIVALLAVCPLRSKNFARRSPGDTIKYERGHWLITLEGDETKNGRADMRIFPDDFATRLEKYLRHARSVLMNAVSPTKLGAERNLDGPLRFSCFGRPLHQQGLHIVTTRATRIALGVSVNRTPSAPPPPWPPRGRDTPRRISRPPFFNNRIRASRTRTTIAPVLPRRRSRSRSCSGRVMRRRRAALIQSRKIAYQLLTAAEHFRSWLARTITTY